PLATGRAVHRPHPQVQRRAARAAQGLIDPARIHTVAERYIAAGLLPPSATGLRRSQGSAQNNVDELALKFDVNVRKNDKFAVTLGRTNNPTLVPFAVANVTGFPTTTTSKRSFAN